MNEIHVFHYRKGIVKNSMEIFLQNKTKYFACIVLVSMKAFFKSKFEAHADELFAKELLLLTMRAIKCSSSIGQIDGCDAVEKDIAKNHIKIGCQCVVEQSSKPIFNGSLLVFSLF